MTRHELQQIIEDLLAIDHPDPLARGALRTIGLAAHTLRHFWVPLTTPDDDRTAPRPTPDAA